MNKTIIININGIIFHIEEEAYEVLQTYMVNVKKHFGYSSDSQEIVGDIENRIAEMFSERLSDQKAVITMDDVREVCAQMGKIEDFEIDEESTEDFNKETSYSYNEDRSLFRDPDDKVLGGVCSGLGHYFGIESKWVRLIFLLVFFFGGAGFLIYIILWIVVPKAKTRADKMRMRGEPANLESFKRSFQEEMGDVKRNFSAAGERARTGLNDPDSGINSVLKTFGKIIIVFIKIIGTLIIFSISMTLIGLILALFFGASYGMSAITYGEFPLNAIDPQYRTPLLWAAFFAAAIPLLVLILLAVRVLFNRKVMSRYFGFSLLIVWLVAVGFSISYITKTAIDFKEEATIMQEINLTPQSTYRLNLRDHNATLSKGVDNLDSLDGFPRIRRSIRHSGKSAFNYNQRISLRVEKADANQSPLLIEEYSAKGRTFEIASERAERINYSIEQDHENLWFASNSILPKDEIIRDQEVYVKLYLPVGTHLFISKEVEQRINIRGLSMWECKSSYSDDGMPSVTEWVMTESGLKCVMTDPQLTAPNPIDSIEVDTVKR